MEEVVGFVFHLEVEVQQTPTVGVVIDSDGQAIQIGSDRADALSRNGHDGAHDRSHLVESGPDPDGPGVAVHPVDDDEREPDELAEVVAEERAASRPQVKAKGLAGQSGPRAPLSYSAPAEDGSVTTARKTASADEDLYAGVGRNAPCPCGSGKKFKMCHGRPGAA